SASACSKVTSISSVPTATTTSRPRSRRAKPVGSCAGSAWCCSAASSASASSFCSDTRWGPGSGSDACLGRASPSPDKRLLRDVVHIGVAGGDAAPCQRNPPVALFSVYLHQIVLSGGLGTSRRLPSRGHAHDRYRAVLAVDAVCR